MKRTALVTASVAALLLSGGAVALAQDAETGPNSRACADAKHDVSRLDKDVSDAVFNERKREETRLDNAKTARDLAKTARDDAQAALDSPRGQNATPEDRAKLQKTLSDAEVIFNARKDDVEKAQRDLDRDSDDVKGLRARLDDARDRQAKDCDEPVEEKPADPPATVTPAPTTPPAAETTSPAPAPADNGSVGGQVSEIPSGIDSGLA